MIPSVSFDREAHMIAVEPEGKGRKHSYLPRALAAVFATVEAGCAGP